MGSVSDSTSIQNMTESSEQSEVNMSYSDLFENDNKNRLQL
ncbi:hypothetical protein SAMN05216406_101238 [Nitrosomonas ureae]|uniref:Uncharacterized protein n=1 Tax=Nitrosomonas ureae TaxID=44577 RepID=A0A1H2DN91_9PROT|nr:hypothetical protein SAMN05216406_101238 [Nitrosomonas ureae]